MKKFSLVFLFLTLLTAAGILLADDRGAAAQNDRYDGRERIKIDRELVKSMTWEERRAYLRAYKKARLEEARRAGVDLKTDGAYRPLDELYEIDESKVRRKNPGSNITYDSGTVTGTAGASGHMVGNLFNTALRTDDNLCCGPVEASGSITRITFHLVNTFSNMAVFSIYSDISGTTANQVTSATVGVAVGLNTVAIGGSGTVNSYQNGSFLAGFWQLTPSSTGLAVDTGTTGSQGFHAITINDTTAGAGTMLTALPGLNAIIRVSGDVATPVELQSFTIED